MISSDPKWTSLGCFIFALFLVFCGDPSSCDLICRGVLKTLKYCRGLSILEQRYYCFHHFLIRFPPGYNHYPFWVFLSIEAGAIILGNVLLCWLFLTQRKLRTKQNFFIISLSVGDLLVGLAIAPCEYCRWVNCWHFESGGLANLLTKMF